MMMKATDNGTIISVVQHKGGVGASTLRCALALTAAREGMTVLIAGDADCAAILGHAGEPEDDHPIATFDGRVALATSIVHSGDRTFDLVITAEPSDDDDHLIVAATPCYLNLRRAVKDIATLGADGFVLLDEEGRSLGVTDVANVLGVRCLSVIQRKPSIARAIDAGVIATRMPDALTRSAREVLEAIGFLSTVDPRTGVST